LVKFVNMRLVIFILALTILIISFLGSPKTSLYSTIMQFDLAKIQMYFTVHDEYFRPPDTSLRFILFSVSILLLMFVIKPSIRSNYNESLSISYVSITCIGIFYVSFLLSNNIYNYAAIILVLLSIFHLLFRNENILRPSEKFFIFSFILMFYLPMISILFHYTSINELDNYFRFLLITPLFFLVKSSKLTLENILLILNISGIISSLYGLFLFLDSGNYRIRGYTSSAIIYSNILAIYFLISLISFFYFSGKNKYISLLCTLLTAFIVIIASSRAPLITLIFIAFFLLLSNHRKKMFKFSKTAILISTLIGLTSLSFSNIPTRILNSYDSAYNYINNNSGHYWQHKDSIVPRLIIWKGSLNMIKEYPVIGVGLSNFNKELINQIENGSILPIRPGVSDLSAGINHAHNQYFDMFAKLGLVGFVAICLFIIISYWFFNSYKNSNSRDILFISLIGKIIILTYAFNMFFHVILSHQQSTLFMITTIVIFAGLLSKTSSEKKV